MNRLPRSSALTRGTLLLKTIIYICCAITGKCWEIGYKLVLFTNIKLHMGSRVWDIGHFESAVKSLVQIILCRGKVQECRKQ